MKTTKLILALIAFSLSFSLVLTGCKNDDDDKKSEISDADLEREAAAFNVFRGLLSLTTDDDATNSADEKGNGIEQLPSNWRTATFDNLDQSLIPVEGSAGVYKIGCETLDMAREFVSSLTDEEFDSDTYSWSLPGFGSVFFSTISGDVSCFATLDVSIPQIPSLSQIKFVPSGTITDAENKFSGKSYYSAGDIIRRKKDNSIWFCVRPSSGEYKKDYSYWICLNPDTPGILKGEVKTAKNVKDQNVQWKFAKNLVSLKIAKAAIHTLNSLAYGWLDHTAVTDAGSNQKASNYKNADTVYAALKNAGYDIRKLAADTTEANFTTAPSHSKMNSFFMAYGSAKTDGKRSTGNNGNARNKLVQPIIICRVKSANESNTRKLSEFMFTHVTTIHNKTETMLSLTDSHDDKYIESFKNKDANKYYNIDEVKQSEFHGVAYTPELYLHTKGSDLGFNRQGAYLPKDSDGTEGLNVIVTPELKIKDHGTAATGYTEVYRQRTGSGNEINSDSAFDYWASLTRESTLRNINGKNVVIDKEAKD